MDIPLKSQPKVSVVDLYSNKKYHMEEATDPVDGYDNYEEPKLTRTYSETEVNNFDEETGHRLYDGELFRPKRAFQEEEDVTHETNVPKIYSMSHGRPYGIEDEYIPGLNFNEMVYKWSDTPDLSRTNSTSSFLDLEDLHAKVSPQQILKQSMASQLPLKRIKTNQSDFDSILDSLPSNFNELPYSQRKKLMRSINDSVDYSQFSIYMKNYFGKKTLAGKLLSSTTDLKKMVPVNTDEKGAKVMEYTLGKVIGFGAWGTIRECTSSADGQIYAMKIVNNKKSNILRIFKHEVVIWERLSHPNILKLIKYLQTDDSIFCLMARVNGGTLFDIVSKWGILSNSECNSDKSTESLLSFKPISSSQITVPADTRIKLVIQFSKQVVNAIQYLHTLGIVHGDIKLENVLVDKVKGPPETWNMVVCDFGMSRYYKQKSTTEVRSKSSMTEVRKPYRGGESLHSRLVAEELNERGLERSLSPHHPGERLEGTRSRNYLSPRFMSRSSSPSKVGNSMDNSSSISHSIESIRQYVSDLKAKELQRQSQVDMNLPDSHIGSLPYASPELLLPNPPPLGPSADIWALGILIYTMLMGKLPFQHSYEPRLRAMIIKGKFDREELSQILKSYNWLDIVITECLQSDITKRLDIDTISMMMEHNNE